MGPAGTAISPSPAVSASRSGHGDLKVAAGESLEVVIDFLFDATQPVFPGSRIAVAFAEDGGERLVAHQARAAYEPLLLKRGCAEDLVGSSLQGVLRDRQPRIIRDLEAYAPEQPHSCSTRLLLGDREAAWRADGCVVRGGPVGRVPLHHPADARAHSLRPLKTPRALAASPALCILPVCCVRRHPPYLIPPRLKRHYASRPNRITCRLRSSSGRDVV